MRDMGFKLRGVCMILGGVCIYMVYSFVVYERKYREEREYVIVMLS